MPPDTDLLRQYADHRDEAAFAEVVRRHVSLVYLALQAVFHKAYLALDECGTEAAAATDAEMILIGGPGPQTPPVEVHVDHPFLFAIQHRGSGACLFFGRVTDPR